MLRPGQPAPWFTTGSPINPEFAFGSLGGQYILLAFLPQDAAGHDEAVGLIRRHRALFNDSKVFAFGVLRDLDRIAGAQNEPGLRWFFDPSGEVSRKYYALHESGEAHPHWVLIDPSLRILAVGGMDESERIMKLVASLPDPDDHAGTPLHAPVLIVPRIFEPELCARLIAFYEYQGGKPSGVMREVGGKTVPVMDSTKRRFDAMIEDGEFKALLRQRLQHRLLPEITKAFQFQPTRVERYMVARYDADGGGIFKPHRDNTTGGTAHRKFACSINLNTAGHEGGDLRFPEFGSKTYRPPTGGAVVFSCSLLHEATPVTAGRRYCFLPFLYDEAGQQLREDHARRMAALEANGAEAGPPPTRERQEA